MQVAKNTAMPRGKLAEEEEAAASRSPYEAVRRIVDGNAVVVFSVSGCCMCTVAKRLLIGLGVGPTVVELDHHASGRDIHALLSHLASAAAKKGATPSSSSSSSSLSSSFSSSAAVPAVFVGGKFLGGIESLMACHINGTLVPLLKEAGALWL